ncbi:UNVERIFIED_CONTAM: hypothetical protein GTU68_006907 [Idotea baltica]|nr:hypothetical protein [Idotea baltica]
MAVCSDLPCKLVWVLGDILLHLDTSKSSLKYSIKDFTLHKRFLREGKATLHLKNQLINIMIANAPPNLLINFVKILSGKVESKVLNKEIVPLRQRMLSNLPKSFEEISPMTTKEIETLRKRQGKMPLQVRNQNSCVPGSSPISSKRKFDSVDKVKL